MNGGFLHFAFSEEQEMVRDTARRFLEENCPESLVRQVLEGGLPFASQLWYELGELGLLGVTVPEEYGGSGLGPIEQCVLAEELGRVLAPLPTISTLYLSVRIFRLAGSDIQMAQWLPKIARGETVCSVATSGSGRDGVIVEGDALAGKASLVADATIAHLAIVETGGSLYLADLSDSSVHREPHDVIDSSRPHGALIFEGTPVERLGKPGNAARYLDKAYDEAAVYLAFEQIGGAEAALAKASDYARERYAFGRPIGSFQAIKQLLADMFVSLAIARANARHACWAAATNDPGFSAAAARAHLSATHAFRHCTKDTIQVHGGAGFMWETAPHLFFRRSEVLARSLGGPRIWERKLINRLEAMAA